MWGRCDKYEPVRTGGAAATVSLVGQQGDLVSENQVIFIYRYRSIASGIDTVLWERSEHLVDLISHCLPWIPV